MDLANRLPRLDLVQRRVIRFTVNLLLESRDDSLVSFPPAVESSGLTSGSVYRRRGQRHVVTADVQLLRGSDTPVIALDLMYDCGPQVETWTVPKQADAEDRVTALLRSTDLARPQYVKADFAIAVADIAATLVPLPLGIPAFGMEAQQAFITAVEGSYVSEDLSVFGFEIRRFDDEDFTGFAVSVSFTVEDSWDDDFIVRLLNEAERLKDLLIVGQKQR